MHKKLGIYLLIGLLVFSLAFITTGCPAPVADPDPKPDPAEDPVEEPRMFRGLADIPEIEDRDPIHVALEAGGVAEFQLKLLEAFAEHTGITVTHELMVMALVYPKVMPELIAGTGAYDAVVVESTWTNEWDPFLFDTAELAEMFEPGGVASLELDLAGISATQLRCASTHDGRLKGLPYYTFDTAMFARQDILDDPTEQAAFLEEYGYELKAPTTYEELYDHAEFFTREAGELLKGEPLPHDFFGVALMAGNFPHIHDEMYPMVWGKGARFMRAVREGGDLVGFEITMEDAEALQFGLEYYRSLMAYAPPGSATGFWDFATIQLIENRAMYSPFLYISLNQWASQLETDIPGGKLAIYPNVGVPYPGMGYVGNFYQGVPRASDNPEAAFWLGRYLASQEGQRDFGEAGWPVIRTDFYEDPKYEADEWWLPVGMKRDFLLNSWDNYLTPEFLDTVFNFNSDTAARIYEMHILPMHRSAVGEITPEEAAKYIVGETIRLQEEFGTLPVTVDPAVTAWLAE